MILRYEDFNDKPEYIDYLENNGLITHGCALCMNELGVCEEAATKWASPDELYIECMPFGGIDSAYFPVSCLGTWHRDECVENLNSKEEP